jgi:hypothetical protein
MTRALLLVVSLLVPTSAGAVDPPVRQERIEEIALDVDGKSGTIRTAPVTIAEGANNYRFGSGPCRAHRLAPPVLEQLFTAMREKQPVRIESVEVGSGESAARRVRAISFFPAP